MYTVQKMQRQHGRHRGQASLLQKHALAITAEPYSRPGARQVYGFWPYHLGV